MDETIRLIKMAHEGDKEARETLVLDNVGLVWSIVRRYFLNQTQTQIAGILGISQVQVSRLEKKILKQMKEKL